MSLVCAALSSGVYVCCKLLCLCCVEAHSHAALQFCGTTFCCQLPFRSCTFADVFWATLSGVACLAAGFFTLNIQVLRAVWPKHSPYALAEAQRAPCFHKGMDVPLIMFYVEFRYRVHIFIYLLFLPSG